MPTDGANFQRMKACYGKAYTAARNGAKDSEVATLLIRGIEREIRMTGGSPEFCSAVDLLALCSRPIDEPERRLLAGVDCLRRDFADSSLARDFAAAVETLGLTAINEGREWCRTEAAKMLLAHVCGNRCEGMSSYLTINRTQSIALSQLIVGSTKENLMLSEALPDLAVRMLNPSPSGLPAKASKESPIEHSASALNGEVIGGGF